MRSLHRLASSFFASVAVLSAVLSIVGAKASFANEPLATETLCPSSCYCSGLVFDPCDADDPQILCFCNCDFDFGCS